MDWIIEYWKELLVGLVLVFDRGVIWGPTKHRDFIVELILWLGSLLKKIPLTIKGK